MSAQTPQTATETVQELLAQRAGDPNFGYDGTRPATHQRIELRSQRSLLLLICKSDCPESCQRAHFLGFFILLFFLTTVLLPDDDGAGAGKLGAGKLGAGSPCPSSFSATPDC